MTKTITVLGSTGSVGRNTLEVIDQHRDHFEVFALTANTNIDTLFEQIKAFNPNYAVVIDEGSAVKLSKKLQSLDLKTEVLSKEQSLINVVEDEKVDIVMAAIVGIAGLKPTYHAAKKGKRILLANKETLVASGHLFMDAIKQSNSELLPVDSEHNAIFQCLPKENKFFSQKSIHSIILTASGGPFYNKSVDQLQNITPQEAIKHPNWSMGAKISVDSATMVNKALEMAEAYWLFEVPPTNLEVMIHPESIVHSLVHYKDGSYLAQIGAQDMKIPIANSLFYPEHFEISAAKLNLFEKPLIFKPVDYARFPAVKLMYQIMSSDDFSFYSIIYNAVNEALVNDFLAKKINFISIVSGINQALDEIKPVKVNHIDDVLEIDENAREWVQNKKFLP